MKLGGQPFKVGTFLVEPKLNRVGQGGRWVTVRPQVMDALVFLAERRGQVVTADELMDQVWKDVIVGSGSLYNCINELRRAFDDDPHAPQYIETISKRGYRLTAPVQAVQQSPGRSTWKRAALGVLLVAAAMLLWQPWEFEPPIRELDALPSIAVMPFADLSPQGDQSYFADGIAEELLNSLAGIKGLQVAARTSSFHFKNREPTIAEVGEKLGVTYVVEGSVRKDQDRIRITAQLIGVSGGYHLWSQTYERDLVDVFAIQDEISSAIVAALVDEMALSQDTDVVVREEPQVDLEAWREFLLGLHLLNRRTPEDFDAAIVHFEAAIELDPGYAPAYANLAMTYWLLHIYDQLTSQEAYERARPYALRAIELDPRSAQAHAGMYFMEDLQNIPDPEFRHLKEALALNPSYSDALNWMAGELENWRRYAEAETTLRRALEIDPLSVVINSHFVINLLRAGRRDEALEVAQRLATLDAGWGARRIGSIDFDQGDYPAAVAHYLEGLERAPGHFALGKELSRLFSELGLTTEAGRVYASDRVAYYNHLYAGEWKSAVRAAEAALGAGGDTAFFEPALAQARYFARNYEEAASSYKRALPDEFIPGYQAGELAEFGHVFYAMALREAGDANAAALMFGEALDDVEKQGAAGYSDGWFHQLKGMTLLYQGQVNQALAAFEAAFEAGYRQGWVFAAPLFDPIRDERRFIALVDRYESARTRNLAGVLALLCTETDRRFGWHPLPETCQGGVTLASSGL